MSGCVVNPENQNHSDAALNYVIVCFSESQVSEEVLLFTTICLSNRFRCNRQVNHITRQVRLKIINKADKAVSFIQERPHIIESAT